MINIDITREEFVMKKNTLILGENQFYDMDCYKTKVNNNILVVGAAGTGKTRSLVIPNILQASGSYIISDPKGQLYRDYAPYLKSKGYDIKVLDLINPAKSTKYNFFDYIETERDIIKISHLLMGAFGPSIFKEPFWDDCAEMLLSAVIAYLVLFRPKEDRTLKNVIYYVSLAKINDELGATASPLDLIFKGTNKQEENNFAYRQYKKFRCGAGKTLRSVLIALNSKFKNLDFDEMHKMTETDEMDLKMIGSRRTAVFVIVSDMERSLDVVANLFYSQVLDELCKFADRGCGGRLPRDVRFILDDFATNCVIADFPKKISAFRSRGISAMLMLQAEPQLEACYPKEGDIITGNCDNYIYLGGNDLKTAESIGRRCNVPTDEILNMPVGTSWLIRRGQKPIFGKLFDVESFLEEVFGKNMEDDELTA